MTNPVKETRSDDFSCSLFFSDIGRTGKKNIRREKRNIRSFILKRKNDVRIVILDHKASVIGIIFVQFNGRIILQFNRIIIVQLTGIILNRYYITCNGIIIVQ